MITPFRVSGIGLHGGLQSEVSIGPGALGSGVVFIKDGVHIPLHPRHLHEKAVLSTAIFFGDTVIRTVEHLLAALMFVGLPDVTVTVYGDELPILDGSALGWYRALKNAGAGDRVRFSPVDQPYHIVSDRSEAYITPIGEGEAPVIDVTVTMETIGLAPLRFRFYPESESFERIAAARTFVFEADIAAIRAAGMAKGGALDNALVLGPGGPVNPGGYLWADEPARHKVVDFIGDLAFLGGIPRAETILTHPGHHLHHGIVRRLSPGSPQSDGSNPSPYRG
jgi:UDP-3-O-[3-hydroxymyristoyl] N-acetylglucosamine deacetylase